MNISIIIPTYNEAENIGKLVRFLLKNSNNSLADIIVADGGSTDNTREVAAAEGAIVVLTARKGRGAQMNYGASLGKGDVLYFIHADCYPPQSFIIDIEQALQEGYDIGRYRTRFDVDKTILKINAWFTRFDFFMCMGGDQTLFIKRPLFEACDGFNENMKIMEEFEFCKRARQHGRYKIFSKAVLISARKYETNGWLQVQLANAKVVKMYITGSSQEEMLATYKKMLNYRENSF
ncbi:MAG: TIGR04283 family arsenosugar biosynthesis glycosyltransferase [Chitinophagaceae bacterium]|jgi:rSAM/selenodomain-associated transferase 2|nr:TIGR04283 family arsenosugar biosynthesis glycosyltransferase [Chitinophagaceae bacterium]